MPSIPFARAGRYAHNRIALFSTRERVSWSLWPEQNPEGNTHGQTCYRRQYPFSPFVPGPRIPVQDRCLHDDKDDHTQNGRKIEVKRLHGRFATVGQAHVSSLPAPAIIHPGPAESDRSGRSRRFSLCLPDAEHGADHRRIFLGSLLHQRWLDDMDIPRSMTRSILVWVAAAAVPYRVAFLVDRVIS